MGRARINGFPILQQRSKKNGFDENFCFDLRTDPPGEGRWFHTAARINPNPTTAELRDPLQIRRRTVIQPCPRRGGRRRGLRRGYHGPRPCTTGLHCPVTGFVPGAIDAEHAAVRGSVQVITQRKLNTREGLMYPGTNRKAKKPLNRGANTLSQRRTNTSTPPTTFVARCSACPRSSRTTRCSSWRRDFTSSFARARSAVRLPR